MPNDQEIGEFYVFQERRATDFEAPKLWKSRSGFVVGKRERKMAEIESRLCYVSLLTASLFVPSSRHHFSTLHQWVLFPKKEPGQQFHNFRASESIMRRFWTTRNSQISWFVISKIVKEQVGLEGKKSSRDKGESCSPVPGFCVCSTLIAGGKRKKKLEKEKRELETEKPLGRELGTNTRKLSVCCVPAGKEKMLKRIRSIWQKDKVIILDYSNV